MCDEIRANQEREYRVRAPDDRLEILERYDGLIAKAQGDAPLREFWCLSKRRYQEDIERVGMTRH